jgi:hypothetical protein
MWAPSLPDEEDGSKPRPLSKAMRFYDNPGPGDPERQSSPTRTARAPTAPVYDHKRIERVQK